MCGIVGYVGEKEVVPVLLAGLKTLEYRGYDSSGIAVHNGSSLSVVKRAGRIANLESALKERRVSGHCGIGHTRWATHGVATDLNAHPFVSTYGKFAVVHNGILTNYLSVAAFLRERGVSLSSDTDSEVVAHLIDYFFTGDVLAALRRAVREIKGSFALGVISVYEPNVLYGVRKDSPLILGKGETGYAICSDVSGLSDLCKVCRPLENGEIVRVSQERTRLWDFDGEEKEVRFPYEVPAASGEAEGEDRMLAEIRETPAALQEGCEHFPKREIDQLLRKDFDEIVILGCGSAYHAGLIFKAAMREIAGKQVREEIASEFLTERGGMKEGDLVIAISQSGETADTLLAVSKAKRLGATVLSICNVRASSLVRLSDFSLITRCGRECAVAATKSYSAQVHALLMICLEYAEIRGDVKGEDLATYRLELEKIPEKIERVLAEEDRIARIAHEAKDAEAVFFLGRGGDYFAAREGSLKLKEISYLFSEAYPSGELKHGTLALMEKGVYGVAVATDPKLAEKNASTVAEITCRGATAVVIAPESLVGEIPAERFIPIPDVSPLLSPLLTAAAMQLFAYFVAKERGCDVDRPRNLAKSVTVE